jgi:Phosphotransferase enzyme family
MPKQANHFLATSEAQRSPKAHISLYKKFLQITPYLLPNQVELIRPTLWHWDIHAPNIFVDGGRVSSLIDWQTAWLGPLFLQARHPRLLDYNGELMLKLPENFKYINDEDERARLRTNVEKSIVLYTYEAGTARANPLLKEVLHVPQGRTRRQTVEFATDTWDGDILPFRQCLIRIARFAQSPTPLEMLRILTCVVDSHWSEFNTEVPCPISFTAKELENHHQDGEGWNENADFWDSLDGFVNRDGWTSNETYKQALEMFAELRELGLKYLDGDERDAFEQSTRWAAKKGD